MSSPLLTTKLYIPPPRPRERVVPRPRLIERLNEGLQRKLTLLSAPAGFGKTTLLNEWIHSTTSSKQYGTKADTEPADDTSLTPYSPRSVPTPRFAWLSLDSGDNDLTRFLTYLIAALQTVKAEIGQGLPIALQSPGPVNVEAVLTTLLNELAGLPDGLILVLDDYHVIECPPIDAALTFVLDHLPPSPGGLHLVIATRTDPTLPLSRLRARGQLTELRADDLRFTTDEAAAFLNQALRLPISPGDVQMLERRTEGWITGLQLAAVAMQGIAQRDRVAHFIHSFGGSHRYVIDYLVDEVLDRQTSQIQAFLLQTAILDRLTAPLCNTVVGRRDGQAFLEQLEAANLFLVPLDGERRWYRYHHLFADLLTHRLTQTSPELIPELHRRASDWYESKGFFEDAFQHAQAAGDRGRAAGIIEEHWQDIVHRGELTKLRRWLDALGPEWTTKSAPLSMAYCWIHHLMGANDAIPRYLQDTRTALKQSVPIQDDRRSAKLAVIPSLVETMESIVALCNGRASKAKEHAQRGISLIPDDSDPIMRGLLHGAAGYRLARAHRELGEYDQACAVLLDVLAMLKASQNCLGVANAVWVIAGIYREWGKTQEAIALCRDTLAYIGEHHWENMPSSGMVNLVLADLQAGAGDLEASRSNLEIGRRLVEPLSSPEVLKLMDRVATKLDSLALPRQPLVEPLSPRELEILQLIAQGLSNREIGERLFLALNTIKGHNRNIFGKLGVKNRTQAINKARMLGILFSP